MFDPIPAQIRCDLCKLIQRCLQILNNFGCEDRGIGQVVRVLQIFIAKPSDIEAQLVALLQLLVTEAAEAFGFVALEPVRRIKTRDKMVEIGSLQRVGLEREVLVRAEIIDPQRLCPRQFARRLRSKNSTLALTPCA